MASKLSQAPSLLIVARALSVIPCGLGLNAIFRPAQAFGLFEFSTPPTSASSTNIINALMSVYGIRNILMAASMYTTAYYGDRKSLGWMTIASGCVAFADGVVVKSYVGHGEWNHWGIVPVLIGLGGAFLGAFDSA